MPISSVSRSRLARAWVQHHHRSPGEVIYLSLPRGPREAQPFRTSPFRVFPGCCSASHEGVTAQGLPAPLDRAGGEPGLRGRSAPARVEQLVGRSPVSPKTRRQQSSPSRRSRVGHPFRRVWGDRSASHGAAAEPNFRLDQHLLRHFAAALSFRHDQVNDEGKGKYYYYYYCYYYYS